MRIIELVRIKYKKVIIITVVFLGGAYFLSFSGAFNKYKNTDTLSKEGNKGVLSFGTFKDYLYAGIWDFEKKKHVWRMDKAGVWECLF